MTEQKRDEAAAEAYANQFVARPRDELEPWQEELAQHFLAGIAHERQRSKLLEDAIIEATADSHTDILRRPIHNVLTKALKRYRGEE